MPTYLDLATQPTPEQLIAQTLANLTERIDGWSASSEGVLEVALAEELSRLGSDLAYLAFIAEPARAFREFGTSVANLPRLSGTAATMTVRLTLATAGATAPAGVLLIGTTVDGLAVQFTTDVAATAATGASTVDVPATATDVGDAGNDVPTGPLTLASGGATVVAAAALTASTGGTDPETDLAYQSRLVEAQGLLTRSVVLAANAAVQARSVAGVYRALGVDNYDAQSGLAGQERTLSVFVVDASGGPVTAAVRTAVQTLLQSLREVNFVIRVASPTYVPVTVSFTAHAFAGRDTATVLAAVVARVYALLDPGTWAGGDQTPPVWTGARTVRYLDLAAEIDRVEGVDYVDSLTINGGTTDVLLGSASTPAVLPASRANGTTVTGTVAAAGT